MKKKKTTEVLLPPSLFDKNGKIKNYKSAQRTILQVAELGDPFAQNLSGHSYLQGKFGTKDYQKAVYWFERAAKTGFVEAIGNLALIYEFGLGVPQDHARAFKEYAKASRLGDPWATCNLGVMYLDGHGTRRNGEKGIELLRLAAKAGDSKAMYNLGAEYDVGGTLPKSIGKAKQYMKRAAGLGNTKARKWLAEHNVHS